MERGYKSLAIFPPLVTFRRALRGHPEFAFEEGQTASVIIGELKRLGISYQYDGKGSGVIGLIEGKNRILPLH